MSRRRQVPAGFWVIWTAVAMDLLGFGIVIPLLPLYADSFGASPATIGILVASYSLAQFVFSPLWGRASDRVGRRPILLITIAGSAIGSLILGLAGSVVVLFVGRVIDGISGASVAVARAAVADAAEPADRPRLMGLLGAAFGIGFVLGPVIGGIAALWGPSVPFFVAATISAINFALAARRVPETLSTPGPATTRERKRVSSGPLRRLILTAFVGMVAFSAFEATFALLGERRFGMSLSTVSLTFAGVGVVLVATQGMLAGPLGHRFEEHGSIRIALAANTAGFILVAEANSWPMLAGGLGLLAFGQGLLVPMISSSVAGLGGASAGAALGIQASASGLARVVGPVMGGALFTLGTAVPYRVAALLTALIIPLIPGRPTRTTAGVSAESPSGPSE